MVPPHAGGSALLRAAVTLPRPPPAQVFPHPGFCSRVSWSLRSGFGSARAYNLRSDRPGWVASRAGASDLPRNGHLPLLCAGTRGLSPADATRQSRQPGGDHPRFPPSPGQRPSWPAGAVFPTLPLSPAHAPVQLVHAAPVYPHPAGQEPGAEVSPPDLCPPPAGLFLPQAAWALGCPAAAALPRLLREPSLEGSVGGLGGGL